MTVLVHLDAECNKYFFNVLINWFVSTVSAQVFDVRTHTSESRCVKFW